MVKIIYKEDFNLTVEGHAGTAVIGQDILCSAVSILIYTLAQSVLENSFCMEEPPIVSLESGKAEIKCRPKQKYKRKIKDIFNTIMTGFDLLANSYEKNIKIFLGGGLEKTKKGCYSDNRFAGLKRQNI